MVKQSKKPANAKSKQRRHVTRALCASAGRDARRDTPEERSHRQPTDGAGAAPSSARVQKAAEALGAALMSWHEELTATAAGLAQQGGREAERIREASDDMLDAQRQALDAGRREVLAMLRTQLASLQQLLDTWESEVRNGAGATPNGPCHSVADMALAGMRFWSAAATGYQRLWLTAAGALAPPTRRDQAPPA